MCSTKPSAPWVSYAPVVTSDPNSQKFAEELTEVNQGKACYSGLRGLGHLGFEDDKKNRRKIL